MAASRMRVTYGEALSLSMDAALQPGMVGAGPGWPLSFVFAVWWWIRGMPVTDEQRAAVLESRRERLR